MKRLLSIIIAASASLTMVAQGKQVTVTNPSNFSRISEPIVIDIDERHEYLSAVVSCNGVTIDCQLDDTDGNGINDQLCFLTSLEKKEKKTFNVTLFKHYADKAAEPKVYAQMMMTNKKVKSNNKQDLYISSLTVENGTNPYWMLHHHGPAFENEMVAYRIYFDERQTVDIYGKYRKGLELKDTQFYPDAKQKADGYGDDVLWVGQTFGLGALRGWADGKPQMLLDVNKRTLSVMSAGPLRTIVKVEDKGWNPYYPEKCKQEQRVDMTTIYTLYTGRRDCMVDMKLKGKTDGLHLATGIINVKNSEEYCNNGLRGCWGTDWPVSEKDSAGHKRETVGLGICIPAKNVVEVLPANKDNYPYVVAPTEAAIHYAITFASDNETFDGSYHNASDFFNYLKQWRKRLEDKVKIEVKDMYM